MSRIAFPFFTLGSPAVFVSPWMLGEEASEFGPGSGWLENWDQSQDVAIRRHVRVDVDLAASQLGIPAEELELALLIRVGTGAGSMPRILRDLPMKTVRRGASEFLVEEAVAGSSLSNRLLLETALLLLSVPDGRQRLSPAHAGARLWSDRLDLRLEGEEPRFPMEVMSFSERFPGRPESHSPWYLHWAPAGLERDFGGAVRLYLNSDRPDFIERFLEGDRTTVQIVLADTMQQIIGHVLELPDADEVLAAGDDGSIAAQAVHWLGIAFPGLQIAQIRSLREHSPPRFHAAILAAADISGDA